MKSDSAPQKPTDLLATLERLRRLSEARRLTDDEVLEGRTAIKTLRSLRRRVKAMSAVRGRRRGGLKLIVDNRLAS